MYLMHEFISLKPIIWICHIKIICQTQIALNFLVFNEHFYRLIILPQAFQIACNRILFLFPKTYQSKRISGKNTFIPTEAVSI